MAHPEYKKYTYDGPVMEFDTILTRHWAASTYAPSEKKARSNMAFQYKRQYGKTAGSKITLPGKIIQVA